MTTFNPILKSLEIRTVLLLRKKFNLTRAEALLKLRNLTNGKGIETVYFYNKLFFSRLSDKDITTLLRF